MSTITQILTNPRYTGYHFWRPAGTRSGRTRQADSTYVRSTRRTHAALIPLADFLAVQKRRAAEAKPRQSRQTNTDAVFFHRVTCTVCQRVMSVTSVPYGQTTRINYRCRSNPHHQANFNLAEAKLIKLVVQWLRTTRAVPRGEADPLSVTQLREIVGQQDLRFGYSKPAETVEISAGRGMKLDVTVISLFGKM